MSKEFDVAAALAKPRFITRIFGRRNSAPEKKAQLRNGLSREDRFMLRHAALIEELFAFLARTGLDPIPDHYELAWYYLTCASSTQRTMIQECMLENGGIDPAQATELLDKIRTALSERELQGMVESARQQMNEVLALNDESGRQVADFGDALGESALAIAESANDGDVHAEQIKKLQSVTATMIERTAKAEARLKANSKAISQLRSRLAQSQKQALSDPLTNLPNRRAFETCLKSALDSAHQSGRPLSVAFCDIDYFKRINDTHGHATGDRVIHHVAEILNRSSNARVHVARHGGEEFALIFEQICASEAAKAIDQIRLRLSAKQMVAKDTLLPIGNVTLSAGVAELNSGESATSLLARADQALYEAKNTGRDKVCIAP